MTRVRFPARFASVLALVVGLSGFNVAVAHPASALGTVMLPGNTSGDLRTATSRSDRDVVRGVAFDDDNANDNEEEEEFEADGLRPTGQEEQRQQSRYDKGEGKQEDHENGPAD